MITIEVARLSQDSAHLNRAARWLNEEWGRELGFSVGETLDWCLEVVASDREALFGAVRRGALIGVALLVKCDLESEPELSPWLSGLYVAPPYRGHGIGAMLMVQVEKTARQVGHPDLSLYCLKGPLEGYYAGLGWRLEKQTLVDRQPAVVMRKPLNG